MHVCTIIHIIIIMVVALFESLINICMFIYNQYMYV